MNILQGTDLGNFGVSAVTGALVAAQDIPGLEIADRIGMAGTAIMVLWWMLTSFSRRLDKLTDAIDRLNTHASKERAGG